MPLAALAHSCPGCSGSLAAGCAALPCGCVICEPCVRTGLPFGSCPRCAAPCAAAIDFPPAGAAAELAAELERLRAELELSQARRLWEVERARDERQVPGMDIPDDSVLSRWPTERVIQLARDSGCPLLHERDTCLTVLRRLRLPPIERLWADRQEFCDEEGAGRLRLCRRAEANWRRFWRIEWQERLDADARGELAMRRRRRDHAAATDGLAALPEDESHARSAITAAEQGDRDRYRYTEHQEHTRLLMKRWQLGKEQDARPQGPRWPLAYCRRPSQTATAGAGGASPPRQPRLAKWQAPPDAGPCSPQRIPGAAPLPRLVAREVRMRQRLRLAASPVCGDPAGALGDSRRESGSSGSTSDCPDEQSPARAEPKRSVLVPPLRLAAGAS